MIPRPDATEVAPFFQNYVDLVDDGDILKTLEFQWEGHRPFLATLPPAESNRLHAPYSWTIKQVVGHLIDTEKIFGYRAHRIANRDSTPLPGFDQDELVRCSVYEAVDLLSLVDEFAALRQSNLMFLQRIPPDRWNQRGTCDGHEITVRAMAFIMAGHVEHHLRIIRSRVS